MTVKTVEKVCVCGIRIPHCKIYFIIVIQAIKIDKKKMFPERRKPQKI